MAEAANTAREFRVRNVSLHSKGKTETGTLYLDRHHLIFRYTPDAKAGEARTQPAGQHISAVRTATDTGNATGRAPRLRASASLDGGGGEAHRDSTDSATKTAPSTPKIRPKEIWIPYPMINHGLLRPSHAQRRPYIHEGESENGESDLEEASFPPVFGTNAYNRPSTDSARLAPYTSPQRPSSPATSGNAANVNDYGRSPALRIRRRDFQMLAFHFHPSSSEKSPDETAREVFYCLRSRCCVDSIQSMHAFHFKAPQEEIMVGAPNYDARREFARMGIGGKAAEGPGSAWRISDINRDYEYSPTYPRVLCVPQAVSDNILKYGGAYRSKNRIPALTYLHSNGGSITRSSQPMCGIQSKRNAQDERLVSAIFSSHTPLQLPSVASPPPTSSTLPSTTTLESVDPGNQRDPPTLLTTSSEIALDEKFADDDSTPHKRIYGSTRRNLIIDARPRMNALANRATGGGIEDVNNYTGPPGSVVERVFLNIANIHAMRKSLDKIIESFANSDYLNMKPNQELLRNSGWLSHIANMVDGAEMVARIVGLGGSHVLVHCSDGWDRTSQVAALAEIMLDPYYRSLQGFITLVQKDFLSFGHKFNHRHGIQGSEKWFEIENERVAPSRTKDSSSSDSKGINAFSSKALSGAKNWFDKNKGNLFGQPGDSKIEAGSRPPSPPSNSLLHSTATSNTEKDREQKTDIKEIAPIFHQFLDAVFQLQYQSPAAFEFNERFLRRLFYQAHSGQYGEFLFNTEQDRSQYEDKFPSVWAHFLSRKHEFMNPEYVPKTQDPLLFPRRQGGEVEVRWWAALFGRQDEEMNTPRALAPPDSDMNHEAPMLSMQPSMVSLGDGSAVSSESHTTEKIAGNHTKEVTNGSVYEKTSNGESTDALVLTSIDSSERNQHDVSATSSREMPVRPALLTQETDATILAEYAGQPGPADVAHEENSNVVVTGQTEIQEGDPLGVVLGNEGQGVASGRLDFGSFARQSAYSDR